MMVAGADAGERAPAPATAPRAQAPAPAPLPAPAPAPARAPFQDPTTLATAHLFDFPSVPRTFHRNNNHALDDVRQQNKQTVAP